MLKICKTPIVYVTRDIERALGLPLDTPNYFIISNATPFAKREYGSFSNVQLIENKELLDTHELLELPKVIEKISSLQSPSILVFKNTKQIETICATNNWPLLNPLAELSARVEEKISQVEWLGDLAKFLPPHKIVLCKNISWKSELALAQRSGAGFILQFNRAHTGLGTFLIESEAQLAELQTKFPDRPVRITEYVPGPMFTSNNVVTTNDVLADNINYQITGLSPFTDNKFATIGNDWTLPNKILSAEQKIRFAEIARAVGQKLRAEGWRGLFGIDVVLDESTGQLHLIEINARQPASTTFESTLQSITLRTTHYKLPTNLSTFQFHLASLQNLDISKYTLTRVTEGAQIIVRNPANGETLTDEKIERLKITLCKAGFNCIEYANTKPGSDRLRIQSEVGIIEAHNILNESGKRIIECLKHN